MVKPNNNRRSPEAIIPTQVIRPAEVDPPKTAGNTIQDGWIVDPKGRRLCRLELNPNIAQRNTAPTNGAVLIAEPDVRVTNANNVAASDKLPSMPADTHDEKLFLSRVTGIAKPSPATDGKSAMLAAGWVLQGLGRPAHHSELYAIMKKHGVFGSHGHRCNERMWNDTRVNSEHTPYAFYGASMFGLKKWGKVAPEVVNAFAPTKTTTPRGVSHANVESLQNDVKSLQETLAAAIAELKKLAEK